MFLIIKLILLAYAISLIYGAFTGQKAGVVRMHQAWVKAATALYAVIVDLVGKIGTAFRGSSNQ